jgi:hypothetical protein
MDDAANLRVAVDVDARALTQPRYPGERAGTIFYERDRQVGIQMRFKLAHVIPPQDGINGDGVRGRADSIARAFRISGRYRRTRHCRRKSGR